MILYKTLYLTIYLKIILVKDEYLRQYKKGQFQKNLLPIVVPAAGCCHRLSELPGPLDPAWPSYLTAAAEIPGTTDAPERHCLHKTLPVLKKKKIRLVKCISLTPRVNRLADQQLTRANAIYVDQTGGVNESCDSIQPEVPLGFLILF